MPVLHRLSPLFALSLALLTGCDLSLRHETLEFDDPTIVALALDGDSGDITIIGDPDATQVTVEAAIHGRSTELRSSIDAGVLELGTHCASGPWSNCAVDWTITVPTDLAATLHTGSGDIEASDLSGKLELDTGSGDIVLSDLSSPTLDVETGSGDVIGHALACEDFEGSAGSGDLDLSLTTRPRRVAWKSGSGDIELSLPEGEYDLDIETGSGDVDLSGIGDDPDADSLLSLTTGSGDVSVEGR
ncbi:DUF4097 family beta strand repeat-containing protein [Nannocystaceae bacterium ST9]